MQTKYLLTLLFLVQWACLLAQKSYVINGYIEDESSGERLIGAAIADSLGRFGTVTNNYGYFNLSNTEGVLDLRVTYIGYQTKRLRIDLQSDTTLLVKMTTKNTLQTVEINAQKQDRIEERAQMSQITVPIEQLKKMPMLLGEADILKSLQLLPGVKAGTEGTSGIYVRGGSPDQNLILLDGVPVYNAAHIGGLFSIFNSDAIKGVTLTKGGFPARYGGRLSSVLDISLREGNKKKLGVDGSIGMLTSRLTVEGPILKDRMSFIVSGRRTYFDWIIRAFESKPEAVNGITNKNTQSINFYDLNAKLNYVLNEKHNLFLSAYKGNDIYIREDITTAGAQLSSFEQGFSYGNSILALRWNWLYDAKTFVNTTASFSQYRYNFIDKGSIRRDTGKLRSNGIDFISQIQDFSLRTEAYRKINNNHELRAGANLIYHRFRPSETSVFSTDNTDTLLTSGQYGGTEGFIFAEDEWQSDNWRGNFGLHAAFFNTRNTNFYSLQPRLSISYFEKKWAYKASYSRMTQFVHLLTNDALGLPTDSWVPAVANVLPQQSEQFAVGVARTFKNDLEFTVEAFYKTMNNLIAYKEGTGFLTQDPDWEKKVTQGNGNTYGLEFFLQKKEGRLTGWLGYTLAWNDRQFEAINFGETFPFKYDRRHEFSVVALYRKNKRVTFTANWTFATGNAITIPNQIYSTFQPLPDPNENDRNRPFFPNKFLEYGKRNSFRTRPIHRLDVGVELLKKRKHYERKWNLGLYNAYANANPFYYEIRFVSFVYQVNLLPILPFVSYGLKF